MDAVIAYISGINAGVSQWIGYVRVSGIHAGVSHVSGVIIKGAVTNSSLQAGGRGRISVRYAPEKHINHQ
jgi:hypothetical protein